MEGVSTVCVRISDRSHSKVDSKMSVRMNEQRSSSSTAQLRKIKKPLIEKRRRERINECLSQLKSLVLEAMNKDESRYSRMEKADILEMTVEHLKSARQRHRHRTSADVTQVLPPAYALGFNECIQHVNGYLSEQRDVTSNAGVISAVAPLVSHLGNILNSQARCTNEEQESTKECKFCANSISPGSHRLGDISSPNSVTNSSTTEWISHHQQPRYSLTYSGKNIRHQYGFEVPSSFESDTRAQLDYRSSFGDSPTANKSIVISYEGSDELASICLYQNSKDQPCSSDHSDSNSRSSPVSTSSNQSTSSMSSNALSFFTPSALPSPLASEESSSPSPLLTNSSNYTTYSSLMNKSLDCSQSAKSSLTMISPACQIVSWRPW